MCDTMYAFAQHTGSSFVGVSCIMVCGRSARLQVVPGTPLQASLSACHFENHLIPVDSNPRSGGTRVPAKLAYLSAGGSGSSHHSLANHRPQTLFVGDNTAWILCQHCATLGALFSVLRCNGDLLQCLVCDMPRCLSLVFNRRVLLARDMVT